MRVLIMLFLGLLTNAFTAEREMLTLKDGRLLIGLYDEDAGTIEVESPGGTATAKVRIEPDQIAARKSLVDKQPERNFVEEAKKLHEQQAAELAKREAEAAATAREIAKQKEERERRAAAELAAEQRRLEMEDRVRELRREQEEAARKAAAIAAAQEAEAQRIRDIEAKKKAAEIEAKQARLHEIAAAAEQRRQEKAKADAAERSRKETERISQELSAANRERVQRTWGEMIMVILYLITGGLLLVIFYLFWFWPYRIAKKRNFVKQKDVRMILIVCIFLPGIGFLGWLAIMLWVLIASPHPVDSA
jgi:hypothetical protein